MHQKKVKDQHGSHDFEKIADPLIRKKKHCFQVTIFIKKKGISEGIGVWDFL